MKKVWKYLSIAFLLLIGLCCIGVLYIFFVPGSNLFGICYVAYNESIKGTDYHPSGIIGVTVNSNAYDVNVLPSKNGHFYSEMYTNSFGFTTLENKTCGITSTNVGGVVTYNVKEPTGALISTNAYINIYVPANVPINLSLSNRSSHTTINDAGVTIGELNYRTNYGDLDLNNATIIGTMNLDLDRSFLTIAKSVRLNKNSVNLKLSTGKFDSTNAVLGDVNVLSNNRGVINVGICNNFTEDIKTAGGRISINSINNTLRITTSDTKINVENLTGVAVVKLTNLGTISIKNCFGQADLVTVHGDINIENSYNNVSLTSSYGNITVDNAFKHVIASSRKTGNIAIKYNESALHHNSTTAPNDRKVSIQVQDGSASITGAENVNASILGRGHLSLSMTAVSSNNIINAGYGSVNIIVNAESQYLLTSNTASGYSNVNLSQISEFGGYTNNITHENPLKVNGYTESHNQLNISATSGSISVVDTNLIAI